MEVGKLTVQLRTSTGKGTSRRLRSQGNVPGVFYGSGLEAPLSVTVNPRALKASLDPAKGQNTIISVTVEENGQRARELMAMLWEYQVDPIRREVTHVDFVAIDPEKVIEVEVPLVITGKSKGVIDGGQIHLVRHEIPVKCKPADIPNEFVVDVTELDIGDALHVSDLQVPAGVEIAVPGDFGLVTCVAPTAEKAVEEEAVIEEGAAAEAKPKAEGKEEKGEGGDKK